MKRAGLAILVAAAVLAFAVPAWSDGDGKTPPVAALSVSPQPVVAGQPAALDASGSRDPDGSVTSYAWDLDGDGSFESQSGSQATLAHVFDQAGSRTVGVRVLDDSGESADAQQRIDVQAPAEPEPKPAPEQAAAAPRAETAPADASPEPAARPGKRHAAAQTTDSAEPVPARVHAASSQSVSIKDFSFGPRSVTVNVGDTVSWHNTGQQGHSATAKDGSFDTGVLSTGSNGSATFRKAGTFSYFCKPHPFMTATVRVIGSSGGGGGGGGGGGSTQGVTGSSAGGSGATGSGTTSGTAGAADGSLPRTGLALGSFVMVGLAMIAGGVALRRQCAAYMR